MGFMHACDSEEYRITSTKLTSGNLLIMATAKSQKPKKAVIKKSTRKTTAKKTTAKKSIATRAPQRKKKPQKTAELASSELI